MSDLAFLLAFDGRPARAEDLAWLSRLQPLPPRARRQARVEGALAALAHVADPGLALPPGLTLCADVRLDGREDLARELDLGEQAARLADEDLVLCAYARGGVDALTRLVGDYALVLHDAARERVVLLGDLLATRPLAYAHVGGRLVCASSARSLAEAGLVPAERDEEHILLALVPLLESSQATRTVLRHVARLAPGELRVYEHGRLVGTRVGVLIEDASERPGTLEEHVRALRAEIERSVVERLQGPGAVGVMLSGGVDSSAVAGQARAWLQTRQGTPLATFSVLGDEPDRCPETEAIRAIEAQGGLAPTHLAPREIGAWVDEILELQQRAEDPFDVLTGLVPVTTLLAARRAGTAALLTGVDGDLATSLGSNLPAYALARGRLGWAWRAARVAAARSASSPLGPFWSEGLKVLAPRPLRRAWQALLRSEARRVGRLVRETVLTDEWVRRLDLYDRLRDAARRLWPDVGAWGAAPQRRHVARLTCGFLSAALARYQRVAWAAGLEVRHPLASVRLLRSTVRAPYWAKDADGVPKGLLRRVGADVLPPSVLERPAAATNLNTDLERAFLAHPRVREACQADIRRAGLLERLAPGPGVDSHGAMAGGAPGHLGAGLLGCWAVARALHGPS